MERRALQWLKVFAVAAVCCFSAALSGCGGSGAGDIQAGSDNTVKAQTDIGDITKGIEGEDSAPFVEGELLVQTRAGVGREKLKKEVLDGLGASIQEDIPRINTKRIKVPAKAQRMIRAYLKKHPHIKYVEKNYLAEAASIPNDDSYATQWHLPAISAPSAWDISTGSSSVSIAIADSGVDPTHPDLAAKLLPGYNFVSNNTDTRDIYGHGTKVAGAAAAISNNNAGIAGVAWINPIVPLVVADSTGYATYSNMAKAIIHAADNGIRVINLSFAGSSSSTTLQNAVNYAWNKGTILFASAGNYGTSTPQYPAACNHAVAVTATTSSDTRSSFSSYGSWVTVAAPGSSILTTTNGGGYASVSGTSFSSPITAGLAALILSVKPGLTAEQVVDILKQNSDDLGVAGFDQYFGYGRINAYKSLTAAGGSAPQPGDTTAPISAITSPANGASVTGTVTVNVSASDNTGISRVELYVNGTLLATETTAPYSFSWDTSASGTGTRYLKAVAYDLAGNSGESSPVTVTVTSGGDTSAPAVIITNPVDGADITGVNSVVLKASATDNVGVTKMEIYVDGVYKGYYSKSSITWNWNTSGLTSGAHSIMVKAYDAVRNVGSASATVYKNVTQASDTTPPVSSITSPANGSSVSGTIAVDVAASDDTGVSRVELYVNGTLHATDSAAPYSFSWDTATSGTGTRYLQAIAYDAAGNAGPSSQITVTVIPVPTGSDTIAPVVTISNPLNGSSITGLSSVTLNASATDNVGVKKMEIYVDGVYKGYYSRSSITWTWNTSGLAAGTHIIMVKAIDAAGNAGSASATVYK